MCSFTRMFPRAHVAAILDFQPSDLYISSVMEVQPETDATWAPPCICQYLCAILINSPHKSSLIYKPRLGCGEV